MQDTLKASLVIGHFRYTEQKAHEDFVKAACALAAATAANKEWIKLNPDHKPGTLPDNPHKDGLDRLMDAALKAQREVDNAKELHEFAVDRFVSLTEEGRKAKPSR